MRSFSLLNVRSGALCATSLRHNSYFQAMSQAPADSILGLAKEYAQDTCPDKVNLAVGVYRDNGGNPYILDCVREASKVAIITSMDYAPINGVQRYVESTQRLCFGEELYDTVCRERMASVQTLSGTGALRVGGELLRRFDAESAKPPRSVVYCPSPTYPNHIGVFKQCGMDVAYYPYYNLEKHTLELESMLAFLEKVPVGSLVVLHACAHNPTGCDPTPEQWQVIVDVLESRQLIPFVDMAYQGFATGDIDADSYLPRLLCRSKVPTFMVAQSFAKNFGLYGHRAGALHILCNSAKNKEAMESQLSAVIRPMYSNPPVFGAYVVDHILRSPDLTQQWHVEVQRMADRMTAARVGLVKALRQRGSVRPWDHLANGVGMMGLSGLTEAEVIQLRDRYHIYATLNGRFAFSGLNDGNMNYVATAIHEVTK